MSREDVRQGLGLDQTLIEPVGERPLLLMLKLRKDFWMLTAKFHNHLTVKKIQLYGCIRTIDSHGACVNSLSPSNTCCLPLENVI